MWVLFLLLGSQIHEQTDWMGGDGLTGPVSDWGTRYSTSDSITVATEGQASLIATSWDLSSAGWERHKVDTTSLRLTDDHIQGFMPGNIDGDTLLDLAGWLLDTVWWYRNNGDWTFTKNKVGLAAGTITPSIWVADVDGDLDADIVVATNTIGVGWFKNNGNGSSWTYASIDNSTGYHRPSVADFDLDDDMDILAVDNDRNNWRGNIKLFRNNGSETFNKETVRNFTFFEPDQAWRVYPADFNNDKYPDIYAVSGHAFIFINRGTAGPGIFDQKYWCADMNSQGNSNADWDGAWAVDINMDGWKDLVTANFWDTTALHPYGFYGHINDGTGNSYSPALLTASERGYTDGSIAVDLDLNGLPDIVGTWLKVCWFRQTPANTFTEYLIDDVMQNKWSHWVYAENLNPGCTPNIDLIVTDKGAHMVYENKMLKGFANFGYLESSVLELGTTPSPERRLQWFGWEVCTPESTTIKFYWRADSISDSIFNETWNGPLYASKEKDSIALPPNPCPEYFQYRVEFEPTASKSDIGLLRRIWLSDTSCEQGIEDIPTSTAKNLIKIINGDKILLSVAKQLDNAELSVYNTAGEKILILHKGQLVNRDYVFSPVLKAKGVYLVVLRDNNSCRTLEKAKFIKYK